MEKIRPFIGNELIKVLTGIRRSGKSVMLELIKEELISQGIAKEQFISVNFENMNNAEDAAGAYAALYELIDFLNEKCMLKAYLGFEIVLDKMELQTANTPATPSSWKLWHLCLISEEVSLKARLTVI